MSNENPHQEESRVSGDEIVAKVKEIINEGNARRVIIMHESGDVIMEIPLTFAVVGALLAPVLAAVGAMAALLTRCVTIVERPG